MYSARLIRRATLVVCAAVSLIAAAARADPDPMTITAEIGCGRLDLSGPAAPTPVLRAALEAGGPIRLAAIGSSSTSGVGAGRIEDAYPAVVARLLKARLRADGWAVAVQMTAEGVGGETLEGALERLRPALARLRPHLLVLQAGANDGLRDRPLSTFRAELEAAAAATRAAGADLALLDSQFFPRIADNAAYAGFQAAVADLAARRGVNLAPRFARMRRAFRLGPEAMTALLARDAFHMNAAGHRCAAQDLVAAIAAGARAAAPLKGAR